MLHRTQTAPDFPLWIMNGCSSLDMFGVNISCDLFAPCHNFGSSLTLASSALVATGGLLKVKPFKQTRWWEALSRPAALTVKLSSLCFFRKKVWCISVQIHGQDSWSTVTFRPLRPPFHKYPFTCIHISSTFSMAPFQSTVKAEVQMHHKLWNGMMKWGIHDPQRIPYLCPVVLLSSLWLWNLTLKWIDLLSIIFIHFF